MTLVLQFVNSGYSNIYEKFKIEAQFFMPDGEGGEYGCSSKCLNESILMLWCITIYGVLR